MLNRTIREFGKDLTSINLSTIAFPMIDSISKGCPKLKTLTLESIIIENPPIGIKSFMSTRSLKALKVCKELKDLKLIKFEFFDICSEDKIKKILPECNVETKECEFAWMSDDSYEYGSGTDSDDRFDDDDSDNSLDVSSDDGEQDSNSEEADESDETNNSLDNSDEENGE